MIATASAIKVGDNALSNNPAAQLDGGNHDSSSVSMYDDHSSSGAVMKQFMEAVAADKKAAAKKWGSNHCLWWEDTILWSFEVVFIYNI